MMDLVAWAKYFKREKFILISECLERLTKLIDSKKWHYASPSISIVNLRGIGISIKYGELILDLSIEDTRKQKVSNDNYTERYAIILSIVQRLNGPGYNITTLKRLLIAISQGFPDSIINPVEGTVIIQDSTDFAIEKFIRLFDMVYKYRIKSYNDAKKFHKVDNLNIFSIPSLKLIDYLWKTEKKRDLRYWKLHIKNT